MEPIDPRNADAADLAGCHAARAAHVALELVGEPVPSPEDTAALLAATTPDERRLIRVARDGGAVAGCGYLLLPDRQNTEIGLLWGWVHPDHRPGDHRRHLGRGPATQPGGDQLLGGGCLLLAEGGGGLVDDAGLGQADGVAQYSSSAIVAFGKLGYKPEDLYQFKFADYVDNLYGNALIIQKSWAKKYPDAAKGLVRGYIRGLIEAYKSPNTAIDVTATGKGCRTPDRWRALRPARPSRFRARRCTAPPAASA